MKNFSTWLLVCFAVMYWGFRIIVALMSQLNQEFFVQPFNITMEIALLFIVLIALIFIVKRKMIGSLIYLLGYGMYFGSDIVSKMLILIEDSTQLSLSEYTSLTISLIGIIIPIAILLDLLADKNRKAHPKDNKTDWFYNNEQYDRKLDDRADKNNYRTM